MKEYCETGFVLFIICWIIPAPAISMDISVPIDISVEKVDCPPNSRYEKKIKNDGKTGSYYLEGCKNSKNTYVGEIVNVYRKDGTLQFKTAFRTGMFDGRKYKFYTVGFTKENSPELINFYDADGKDIGHKMLPKFWEKLAHEFNSEMKNDHATKKLLIAGKKLIFSFEDIPLMQASKIIENREKMRRRIVYRACTLDFDDFNDVFLKHGLSLVFNYTDAEDNLLLSTEISREICSDFRNTPNE